MFSDLRSSLQKRLPLYKKLGRYYYTYLASIPYNLTSLYTPRAGSVLFYPELPSSAQVLYKVFHLLNYKITNDPHQKVDMIFNHQDTTFRTKDEVLNELIKTRFVINNGCVDISKKKVDQVFEKVFGYGLMINPRTYQKKYVKKSNVNSAHDGVILSEPEEPNRDYVYQRVVNNEVAGGLILDFRMPYILGETPFVYMRQRPLHRRFEGINTSAKIADIHQQFSKDEITKIIQFCKEMSLDYGELDILRDNDDKRLYILDVNNTPAGPSTSLSKEDQQRAVEIAAGIIMKRGKK